LAPVLMPQFLTLVSHVRLLDLPDFPMPFFDQPVPPAMPGRLLYEREVVKKCTAEIARSDGFVFSHPGIQLRTCGGAQEPRDWVNPQWNRKAAAFVSDGVRPSERLGFHLT
jgi:NAD(P)H-dependent FMN reductase